jgi:hypothetical protein
LNFEWLYTDWTWVYILLLGFGGFLLLLKMKLLLFPDFKAKIVSFPDYGPEACNTCRSTNKGRMSVPMTVESDEGKVMEVEASICELCLNKLAVGSTVGVSKVGSRYLMASTFSTRKNVAQKIQRNPRRIIGLLFIAGLLCTVLLLAAFSEGEGIQVTEMEFTLEDQGDDVPDDTALRTTNDLVIVTITVLNPYEEDTNFTVTLYHEHFCTDCVEYEDEGVNDFVGEPTLFQPSTVFDQTKAEPIGEPTTVDASSNSTVTVTFEWALDEDDEGAHFLYVIIEPESGDPSIESENSYLGAVVYGSLEEDTAIYLTLKFWIGFVALVLFFAMILLSLLGVIPQDRLPVQAALIVTAFVIVILAFLGSLIDEDVLLVSALDIEGMVIIHPITALAAGFLVAGALEAAGAFEAAADLLNKMEVLKIGKWEVLGIAGTVAILVNVPTIVSMPCGRILGAALMPAALYFGYKIARMTGDLRIVGCVVFGFIVNAAASCGPSPLGGIGTIGEGLARMNIGTFSDAQQMGIMLCTGVCMVILRFVTPLLPADLKEELEEKAKNAESKVKDVVMGESAEGGEN